MLRKLYVDFYSAFSMAEILLVMGIFIIVVTIALPIGLGNLTRENQDNIAKQLESDIFNQQQNAYSGKGSGNFGVYFEQESYWLFEGTSYAEAVTSQEVALTRNIKITNITISGGSSEILFANGELAPLNYGVVLVEDQTRSYQISINQEGAIDTTILME